MSIDTQLADLVRAIQDNTAELKLNNANLERVIAGQAAAMEKLEGAKPATGRGRAKKEEAAVEPKTETVTETPATEAPKPFLPTIPKDETEMKAYVAEWVSQTNDADQRAKRLEFVRAVATELGGKGPAGLMIDAKKAVFYIQRKKLGAPVDFNADYNFDGDPAQGGAAPDAADDDDGF